MGVLREVVLVRTKIFAKYKVNDAGLRARPYAANKEFFVHCYIESRSKFNMASDDGDQFC